MFKLIKSFFKPSLTHKTSEGKRDNKNPCEYCGIELGSDRFSFHKGMHFHSKCIKKWYEKKREIEAYD